MVFVGGDDAVEQSDLFGLALGLQQPWMVTRTDFNAAEGRLDLYLNFPRGARFPCPVEGCGRGECWVHDTEDKTWRHMDFFQHKAYLHARVPRVRCAEHGVHRVGVSWARLESGFTLLFEALLITFATAMPVAKVAEMTREHDTREPVRISV
jgi:transposase